MKYSTILALILIALPSSLTSASSDSIDCSRLSDYIKQIDDYNSKISKLSSDIQSASQDQAIISTVYPLLDKIEKIEKEMNQNSAGFLQTSSYEAASALTLSLATLGDEVVDDKITKVNKDMEDYNEAGSDVDRLELINKIRTSLKELEGEISRYISEKNLEIQGYTTTLGQIYKSILKCYGILD